MSNCTSLDNSTGIEKDSFLKEIENMKKVSEADSELGRFVVKMVGCVTIQEPLLLVLEYVKHGDLYWYLRTISKQVCLHCNYIIEHMYTSTYTYHA